MLEYVVQSIKAWHLYSNLQCIVEPKLLSYLLVAFNLPVDRLGGVIHVPCLILNQLIFSVHHTSFFFFHIKNLGLRVVT